MSELYNNLMKTLLTILLITAVFARSYPMYKQCDPRWGSERLGTSSNTICSAGCLMSSVSMALSGTGHNFNPSTLNAWLTSNGGYVSGDLFVWASVNSQGITFLGNNFNNSGKVANSQIKSNLDAGKIVILNVHNGGHWVLAYSYQGDTIFVNDPGYNTASYTLNEIVDGQNGIYTVVGSGWMDWLQTLYSDVYFGWIRQLAQHRVLGHDDNLVRLD